jgi:hypothetical protein
MAVAALLISIVAVVFTGLSLWYTYLANDRANRAERRDDARFRDEEKAAEVAKLERIGTIMRDELAGAVEAAATDPQAPRRVHAAQSHLELAIATVFTLPACSEYARTADAALLPEAERELGQVIAALGP